MICYCPHPYGAQLPSSVPLTCPHLSASSPSDTRYSSSPCTLLSTLDWKSVISPESPGDDNLFSQVSDTVFFFSFSHSVVCDSLQPHGLQHARLPCPSPSPGACSNSCPLSQSCHPTTSASVIPYSSCLHSFLASGSFS